MEVPGPFEWCHGTHCKPFLPLESLELRPLLLGLGQVSIWWWLEALIYAIHLSITQYVSVSSFLFPFISPRLYPSAWSSFLHLSLYFFLPSLFDHLCPYFQSFWYLVMAGFVQDLCNLLTIRWGTNPVLEVSKLWTLSKKLKKSVLEVLKEFSQLYLSVNAALLRLAKSWVLESEKMRAWILV